jgi:hypothetical protein
VSSTTRTVWTRCGVPRHRSPDAATDDTDLALVPLGERSMPDRADQAAGRVTDAGALEPIAFVATTLNVYVSLFLMRSNVTDVRASIVTVRPSETVTVYEETGLPPSSAGADQLTMAVLWSRVAVRFVGELGGRMDALYSSTPWSTCPLMIR